MHLPIQLAIKLSPALQSPRAEIGISFRHLMTGEAWDHNNRRFLATGLARLPLALAAYCAAADGRLPLSRILSEKGNGPAITVRSLIRRNLERDDSAATKRLAEIVDRKRANLVLAKWGLALSRLDDSDEEESAFATTPHEMAMLLAQLSSEGDLLAPHRQEALTFLRLEPPPVPLRKLFGHVDPAYIWSHRREYRHLGIVAQGPGAFHLVVMAEGKIGDRTVARIAQTVFDFYADAGNQQRAVQAVLDTWRPRVAADHRLVTWEVATGWQNGKLCLEGRVSALEWPVVAITCREATDTPVIDKVRRLGATPPWAIALSPVVHLRSNPTHAADLVNQVPMGTLLAVLETGTDWWFVRSPDGALGWVRSSNVHPATESDAQGWRGRTKVEVTSPLAIVPRLTRGWVKLSAGTRLAFVGRRKDGMLGRTPGKEEILIAESACQFLLEGELSEKRRAPDVIRLAEPFLGVPYLWGGATGWGLDCSGFTQLVFGLAGILLPRDSDQQFGTDMGGQTLNTIRDLMTGDLVFFKGHVGIYLGRGDLLHASASAGCVTINALIPGAPHYASTLVKSFLGGRRLFEGS